MLVLTSICFWYLTSSTILLSTYFLYVCIKYLYLYLGAQLYREQVYGKDLKDKANRAITCKGTHCIHFKGIAQNTFFHSSEGLKLSPEHFKILPKKKEIFKISLLGPWIFFVRKRRLQQL